MTGPVTSPSFTIVHEYDAQFRILHLTSIGSSLSREALDLGFEELITPEAILLLEWGDAVEPLLPRNHLRVEMASVPLPGRRTSA